MRFLYTLFLAFLCLNCSFAQCPPSGAFFTSQTQIDNFATEYPNCTDISDGLFIVSYYETISNLEGLSQLTSVSGYVLIQSTDLLDLSGLENIMGSVDFIELDYNTSLTNLDALSGIQSLTDYIHLLDNHSLNDISGLDNIELGDSTWLRIERNPELSTCSLNNICNHLLSAANSSLASIADNAPGCNTYEEIVYNCSQLARIKNLSFYDVNQNQIHDADEPYYSDVSVMLTPGDIEMFGSPTTQYLEPGNYTATYNEADNENWVLTTDSTSYFLSVGAAQEVDFAFGVYPSQLVSRLTSFITSPPARCNEGVIFDISTRNTGTTTASGTMWLEVDENVTQTNFLTPPDEITTTSPVYYGWYFTDLYPGETFTIEAELGIPGPPDFPVGGFLNFVSFGDYNDANGAHSSEAFRYDAEVRCSFDPNDKLVSPTRFHNEVLLDEDLIYTIRFQNTGNDVAYDVTILDTLDANLDWSTFRVLGSSHSEVLSTSLNDEGVITFDFTDIFLPDSTSNLEGSNGHLTYMIRALEGIDENTVIRNSAGIYFDQNPPVITNTTLSVMVSMLTSTTTPDDLFPDLAILPNPNTGTFQVENIPRGTYNLLNTKGQIIQSGQVESGTLIDISASAQGVYFIQMMIDEQMVTRRLIKL